MAEVTIRRLSGFGDGATPYVLAMDTLPYKENIRWTHIVGRTLGAACARIDLFLMRGGEEYLLRTHILIDTGETCITEGVVFAPGDFRVCARFVNGPADKECELYAYGVVQREVPLV